MKEARMKKLFAVMVAALFLSGCGAVARESGFYEHSSMYNSFNHLGFSNGGHKNIVTDDFQQAKEEKWWGIDIESSK
jgi:uncharacterized protein YceK